MSQDFSQLLISLPAAVKQAIISKTAQAVLVEVKNKYKIDVFILAVRIAAKEVALADLESYLQQNFKLTPEQAKELKTTLINKIFQPVLGYLGYQSATNAPNIPSPPVQTSTQIARPVSAWHLYPEDEQEIKKFTAAGSVAHRDNFQIGLEKEVKRLIDLANLPPLVEETKKRLFNILVSYLRGVRDWVETRGFLMHETAAGGVGFSKEQAEEFLALVDKQKNNLSSLHQAATQISKLDQAAEVRVKVVSPAVGSGPVPGQPQVPAGFKKSTDLSWQKPVIEDMKYARKLVGPLEELAGFSLIDFRRLNPDPAQSAEKVKGKIELLATESLAKKVAAVHAWQSSPLNQLYLSLGQQGLASGQTLTAVIENRQQQNQPTLTLAEFGVINELNRRIKY